MEPSLSQKYAQERAKRLRPEGNKQYLSLQTPTLQDLGEDPWVDYEALAAEEAPLKDGDDVKFLIIGGGHLGLLFAYRLIEAGFRSQDIRIVDTAGGFGGNWYWNRYPGLMCDVESYIYIPLLEETGYIPKHKYSYGAEIRGQCERIAAKWNIRALFCTRVDEHIWDDASGRWHIKMTRNLGPNRSSVNMSARAQFLLLAGGTLSIPKAPATSSFEAFRRQNHVFHTSRWNYKLTGGSQEKPAMVKLRGKRVAIIGTGATAVQVIPEVAKWAEHLYVIQRTPSYCGERNQQETDPETWSLVANAPGWQNTRRINFNRFITNDPDVVDLVNDGWTDTPGVAGFIGSACSIVPRSIEAHIKSLLEVDAARGKKVRARIADEVHDQKVANKLMPWYPGWCKRPTFHDEYLAAFNRANVTLIDTDGKGIERYTERGLVCGGQEIEFDVLILATGFLLKTESPSAHISAPIIGRGARPLSDKWESADYGSLFGIATHQYPNFFGYFFSGAAGSFNLTSAYDVFAKFIAYTTTEAHSMVLDPQKVIVEVTKAAEDQYTDEVKKRAPWFGAIQVCTPSYFNGEGEAFKAPASPEEADLKSKKAMWGGGINDYQCMIEEYMVNEKARLQGFNVRSSNAGQI